MHEKTLFIMISTLGYVLISCDPFKELQVIESLSKYDEVKSVSKTKGLYDLVIKIESGSTYSLKQLVAEKIRSIDGVRSVIFLQETSAA